MGFCFKKVEGSKHAQGLTWETRVVVLRPCLHLRLLCLGPLDQLGIKTSTEMACYANCFVPFLKNSAFAHGVDF